MTSNKKNSKFPNKFSDRTSDRPVPPALQRVRTLTKLLDEAIGVPGTPLQIGLDPIIGLLPGGGDFLTALLSAYVVVEAARMGVPSRSLARMILNILLDAIAGVVPVLGDLLDVVWKANTKNLALLEKHVENPRPSGPGDRAIAILLLCLLGLIVASVGYFAWTVLQFLGQLVTQAS